MHIHSYEHWLKCERFTVGGFSHSMNCWFVAQNIKLIKNMFSSKRTISTGKRMQDANENLIFSGSW